MKKISLILLFTTVNCFLFAQYYFRGTVTDNHGDKLQYVKITAKFNGLVYRSDVFGGFGFSSPLAADSISFWYDGYESTVKFIKAAEFASVVLNALPSSAIFKKNHLSNIALNKKDSGTYWTVFNETYNKIIENNFLFTTQSPSVSFSANINRASYSNVRRFINDMDGPVPPDAVRIEEMLNYFNFHYSEPGKDSMFSCSTWLTTCPWSKSNQLFFINISAKKISMQHLPASNLVFLIDVSGSMDLPNKLPLLQSGLRMLVKSLRAIDTVSIVSYGAMVNIVIDGVAGNEKEKIIAAIDGLQADGPTPGEAGIKLAYQVAKKHFIKGGNNRIFLGADGDFNVGLRTEKELESMIEYQKQSGVYLTCLGVGTGNYKDSKLSVLSQIGNGNFAYIDNEQEAEKVLVSELTQTLFTVADNVYITTTFNSRNTEAYRLIGYDNERTTLTDTSASLEGGEIGSGHALMAIFELHPKTSMANNLSTLADISIHYSMPGQRNLKSMLHSAGNEIIPFSNSESSLRKATCVTMFAMKLQQSKYAEKINWKKLQILCNKNFGTENFIENEFLGLVNKAQKIYRHKKHWPKKKEGNVLE